MLLHRYLIHYKHTLHQFCKRLREITNVLSKGDPGKNITYKYIYMINNHTKMLYKALENNDKHFSSYYFKINLLLVQNNILKLIQKLFKNLLKYKMKD